MKEISIKSAKLIFGLFLFAVGIVLTINANIGLQPWDIFHQGLSKVIHMTMGQTSILVGLIIIIFNIFLNEKVGTGTIANMLIIGLFIDVLMLNHILPETNHFLMGVVMMFVGLFIIGVGSYFYLGVGWGAGPRDGLMVALTKKTKKSVRFVRNSIEITVSFAGFLLGGQIGVGTVITAVTMGYIVQFTFKVFKFDVSEVQHRFIDEDIKYLYRRLCKKPEA